MQDNEPNHEIITGCVLRAGYDRLMILRVFVDEISFKLKEEERLLIKNFQGDTKGDHMDEKKVDEVGSSNIRKRTVGIIPVDDACSSTGASSKNKEGKGSGSRMFTIDLFTSDYDSWVLDTGCGTHICSSSQALKSEKLLKPGQLELKMGNETRVHAVSQGEYDMILSNGLVLELHDCLYVPSIVRNIVSFARLRQDGFMFKFHDDDSIYACLRVNDIYEIEIHNSLSHKSMYNVNAKRLKQDLSQTYLWHCRLGHINKKHISKLQADGILKSTNDSFDKCEACLLGKMTKTPFKGKPERAIELLEVIHTDVCGPLSPCHKKWLPLLHHIY
ncbi:hypothetical protein OSB04_019199 [Centaurea solstitialis]|uniref:GAG-pre-integrase domain-containing protein n=1 Tax=Centaurea solstitialis TaxID=347529 RepID=A0AA38T1D3_9ASTR|nr:hypothetical protein OSB04_019199 [Centaurea solstitialis]